MKWGSPGSLGDGGTKMMPDCVVRMHLEQVSVSYSLQFLYIMGLFRSATCSQQQWPLIVGFPVLGLGLARCLLAEPEPVVTQMWHILSYPLNILRILSILSMWSCCTLADQGQAQERRRFLPNLEGAVSSVTGKGSGLWFWKQVHRMQNKSMSLHESSNLLQ